MKYPAVLLGTIERRPVHEEPVARRAFPWAWIISAIPLVVVLGALPFMLHALWDAWQTGVWGWFWLWAGGDFQTLLPVSQITLRGWQFADALCKRDDVQDLRRRVAAGDVEAAPLAPMQPLALDGSELPVGPTSFSPLKSAPTGRGAGRMTAGIVLLVLALFAAVVAIVFATAPLNGSQEKLPFAAVVAASGVATALGLLGTWLLAAGIRRSRLPVEVTADEWGVRWRGANGRERVIAWHEARAFYQFSYKAGLSGYSRTGYVLDTLDRALFWEVESRASVERQQVSDRLVRLIVTRTNLPLLDVTREMTVIDGESSPSAAPLQVDSAEMARGALPSAAVLDVSEPSTLPTPYGSPVRRSKGRGRSSVLSGCLVMLVAFLLLGLVAGGGALLQREQQDYLAGLPARVHAEQPLFRDSLMQNDKFWPIQSPTPRDTRNYSYADDGYQLTGSDKTRFMDAWTISVYSERRGGGNSTADGH